MRRTLAVLLAVAGILVEPVLWGAQCDAGWAARVKDLGEVSLEGGIDSYREGALEASVEALSDAIESNSLTSTQRAQAHYYRGLAYRELGKPGQAVMDFSSAVSIKNGLSKARMQDALKIRDRAAREAGLNPSETVIATGAFKSSSRTAVPVPPHRIPVPEERRHQGAPLPTTSIVRREPAPPADDGVFSSLGELLLIWP